MEIFDLFSFSFVRHMISRTSFAIRKFSPIGKEMSMMLFRFSAFPADFSEWTFTSIQCIYRVKGYIFPCAIITSPHSPADEIAGDIVTPIGELFSSDYLYLFYISPSLIRSKVAKTVAYSRKENSPSEIPSIGSYFVSLSEVIEKISSILEFEDFE